jgi:hypothetical protein
MEVDHQAITTIKPPSQLDLVDKNPIPVETTAPPPSGEPRSTKIPSSKSPVRHTITSLPPQPPSYTTRKHDHLDNIVRKIERQKTQILSPSLLLGSHDDDNDQNDDDDGNKKNNDMMRMNLMIATSNMGNAMPSHSDVSSLVPHDGGNLYDIIVIGMQEATFGGADDIARGMEEEEEEGDGKVGKVGGEGKKVRQDEEENGCEPSNNYTFLQFTNARCKFLLIYPTLASQPHLSQKGKRFSAPSIVGKVGKVVRKVEETFRGVTSTSDTSYNKFTPQNRKGAAFSFDSPSPSADSTALHSMLSSHLPSYSPCVRYQRGEMRLHIYVRTALVPALTDVEVAAENTGIGHLLANKGGIAARITFTDTSLSFVTCHIQAHEGKEHFQRRCTDLSEILAGTKLGNPKRYDVSLISHHTFVFGDLNFRTDYGKGKKENKEICWKALARGDFQDIYNHDELMRAVCNGECLTGFQEGDCSTFPPTFKVNRHVRGSLGEGLSVEDIYNPQRTPSYCDRILYTSLAGLDGRLKQVKLEAVPSYAASDHNPVRSMFHIDVPTIDKFGLHFPSALMSRRPKEESELRARNSPSKVDSARIVRDLSETPDFDLDHPTLTSEKVENEDEQEADVDYDRICKLTFFDMRCRNLTEMDPSITGGGSDPYIQVRIEKKSIEASQNQSKSRGDE